MPIKTTEVVKFNNDYIVVVVVPAEISNGDHLAITKDGDLVVYNFSIKEASVYNKEKHGKISFYKNAKIFI